MSHKPPNNYKRGTEIEHKIRNILETAGWFVVRSAGSKGLLDLIAINAKGEIFAIQAKRTKAKNVPWSKYKEEIGLLEDFARKYPCPNMKVEFWVWKDRDRWHKHIVRPLAGDIQPFDY